MTDIKTAKGYSAYLRMNFSRVCEDWARAKYDLAESNEKIKTIAAWGQVVVARDTDYIASLEARIATLEAQVEALRPAAVELIRDLTLLENTRLANEGNGWTQSNDYGVLPGELENRDELIMRGFASVNRFSRFSLVTITDAGRAELARISEQGEV